MKWFDGKLCRISVIIVISSIVWLIMNLFIKFFSFSGCNSSVVIIVMV